MPSEQWLRSVFLRKPRAAFLASFNGSPDIDPERSKAR
jgi:hypothetical protein